MNKYVTLSIIENNLLPLRLISTSKSYDIFDVLYIFDLGEKSP